LQVYVCLSLAPPTHPGATIRHPLSLMI
jgi:hypothetical protein